MRLRTGFAFTPNGRWVVLALGIYAAAAVILTWPAALYLTDHLAANPDPPLNAWILSWGIHALTHFPGRLFQANIFYPAPDALAFSDTLLGNQLLFAPVYAATGNPILGYNLTVLGAFVLNGLSMCWLARSITRQWLPSLVAGFVYAFAPLRFPHLIHLQLLSAWWAPLAFLALDAWLREPRASRILGAVLAVWGQLLSSVYLGIMLAALLVPYAVWRGWPERRRVLSARPLRHLVAAGILGTAVFLPVVIPYLRSQAHWGHERGLEDQVRLSAQPTSFLAAYQTNWLYGDLTAPFRRGYAPWETGLFFGLIPLGLAGAGLCAWRRVGDVETSGWCPIPPGYLLVGGLGVVMSLGPILIWGDRPVQWPLPHLALWLWVPGFRGMRVPARFALIVLVPLAVLAGIGAARLLTWIRQKQRGGRLPAAALTAAALLTGITLESLHAPVPLQDLRDLREEDSISAWMAEAGRRGAILEIPFDPLDHHREALRILGSTRHWAPVVNGYSGFLPRSYFELARLVAEEGLSRPVLEALEALGVRTLVIHLDELPERERRLWLQDPPWSSQLELIRSGPNLRLFRIKPARSRSQGLQARLAVPQTLPAGDRFRVGLHLEERSGGPWVNPGPLGQQPVTVTWRPEAGSAPRQRVVPVDLPTLLLAGRQHTTPLSLKAPETPGAYRLEIRGAGFRVEQAISLGGTVPSAEAHRAQLTWIGPPPAEAAREDQLEVAVQVRNLGAGIWRESPGGFLAGLPFRRLARLGGVTLWWAPAEFPARGSEWRIWRAGPSALWVAMPHSPLGQFILRHRWLREGQAAMTDSLALPVDVFPGQAVDLRWSIRTPPAPGPYLLELVVQSPSLEPPATDEGGLRVSIQVRPRDGGPA